MSIENPNITRLLTTVVEYIGVPKSYYDKGAERHRSLGEWLHRKESKVAAFNPDVRPQGSFRYGTVNRPVHDDAEYDLDNICVLTSLTKTTLTQKQLKELYGAEIKAYAAAHSMLAPVTEHHRCWRLPYADEVRFHLDSLPCVPEGADVIRRLTDLGVPVSFANCTVAITDRRHPRYAIITPDLLSSNPRGFARWFEQRAALGRRRSLSENRIKAEIENVPPYEWKTTLQESIQILKRHRDVMFDETPDLAPISMIITNLAASAYEGEGDLWTALFNIVHKMPYHIRQSRPRVPNPADPLEDYADKWARSPALEDNFWLWHSAVKTDLSKLGGILQGDKLQDEVESMFRVRLTEDDVWRLRPRSESARPAIVRSSPLLTIPTAPRPWGI